MKKGILEKYGLEIKEEITNELFLGSIDSEVFPCVTFSESENYLEMALKNENVIAIFTTMHFQNTVVGNKQIVLCENPRVRFFELFNEIAQENMKRYNFQSEISGDATISPQAIISSTGVKIGKNTVVEAGAIINKGVIIGENCVIRNGAVIGSEGLEVKKNGETNFLVIHDGGVQIGNNVSIGSNCTIDRGFHKRDTIISDFVRIDGLVKISHGVIIESGCIIVSNTYLAGLAKIGKNVFIGPNSTISHVKIGDNAFITMGSVVINNVKANKTVSGNFALEHATNLEILKNNISATLVRKKQQ